ncbi:hypothetical protein ACP3A4_002783 [Serratia marcescens]
MRKWLLFILLGGIYLAGMSAAVAKISLNVKWAQDSSEKWSLSISPQGSYELDRDLMIAKCTGTGVWPCEGRWRLYVNNKGIYCDPLVSGTVGMMVGTFAARVASAYNGKTCTLSNLVLDGTEKICAMTYFTGEWYQEWALYSGGTLYATSGCDGGPIGGGGNDFTADQAVELFDQQQHFAGAWQHRLQRDRRQPGDLSGDRKLYPAGHGKNHRAEWR